MADEKDLKEKAEPTSAKPGASNARGEQSDAATDRAPSGTLKDEAFVEGPETGLKVGRVFRAPADSDRVGMEGDQVDLASITETDRVEEYVTLGEDVLEEFYHDGAKRPSTRILFHKGQVVKKSVLDEMIKNSQA